jgi:hypothetical protein
MEKCKKVEFLVITFQSSYNQLLKYFLLQQIKMFCEEMWIKSTFSVYMSPYMIMMAKNWFQSHAGRCMTLDIETSSNRIDRGSAAIFLNTAVAFHFFHSSWH